MSLKKNLILLFSFIIFSTFLNINFSSENNNPINNMENAENTESNKQNEKKNTNEIKNLVENKNPTNNTKEVLNEKKEDSVFSFNTIIASPILLGVMGAFTYDLSRNMYESIKDFVLDYFRNKKNINNFFIETNSYKKYKNFSLNNFFGRKHVIFQLTEFFKKFKESKSKKNLSNNRLLIESEDYNTEGKTILPEIFIIKAFADKSKIPFIEINTSIINNINAIDFLTSLENLLSSQNSIFFLDLDILLENNFNTFDINSLVSIINKFKQYNKSILCIKINKNVKINTEFEKLFSQKIEFYKMDKTDIVEYFEVLLKAENINLNNYTFNEILHLSLNIINSCRKNQNQLTKKILLQEIEKFNIYLNKKNIHENNTPYNNIQEEQGNSNKNFEFKYVLNFKLNNIPGYHDVKKKLYNLIKKLKKKPLKKFPGILLYGPTGTGKTQFVKAIAGESELPILILNTGKIIDKYIGESEKNIEFIFQLAKKHAPCIIFIDEIDELLQKRNSENKKESNFVNEFLQQIDGFSELKGVCLIGATNRLDQIDESILRPGRIDKKILIDYPSLEDRKEIIEYYIETNDMKLEDSLQLENFSDQLDGFTGADIKGLFSYIKDIFEEKNNPEEKNNIISEKIVNDAYKIFKEENKKEDFKFITIKDKKLNTIAGYKFVKEELNNILEELKGQYTKKTKLEGVILHGPPGTGKTQFARVLACESELPLVIISPADLLGVYIGDSERKLTLLFENIRKNSPCIVFIDEMEALFKNRNNNNNYTDSSKLYNNIINTFLQNIDGINALKGVLFIGATNYIELIDPALTRSGRMSNHIKINYPQYKDRIEIVRYYITENNINLKPSISLEYLAERTNGMSPADIEKYLKLIKKIGKDENKNIIDNVIIAEATQQMLLGKKDSDIIMSKETIEQTAYHEACHALLQYILYKEEKSLYKFDFFTIEPRQNTLGVAYGISPAEYLQPTKERYLGSIAIKLAGKAGQEIFFNTTDAGASNDLEGATYLATIMITKYGMGSQLKVFFNETEKNKEINDEIEIILKNEYKKVLQFIENNKELIKNIVKKVFEKNILYENDMETIIKEYEKRIGKKIVYL